MRRQRTSDESDLDDVHYVDQNEEDCQRGRHQSPHSEDTPDVSDDIAVFLGCTGGQKALISRLSGSIEFARPDAISRPAEVGFRGLGLCVYLRLFFGGASLLLLRERLAGSENWTRLRSGRGALIGTPLAGTVGTASSLGHLREEPP